MIRPSLRHACIAVALAVLVPRPAAGSPPIESLVPADADLVMVVRDAAAFRTELAAGPLGSLWNDPELKRFLEPLRHNLGVDDWDERLRKETGYDLGGLLELFSGGFAFYVPSIAELVKATQADEEGSDRVVPFVLLASAGDRAGELEALLLDQEEKEKRESDVGDSTRVDVEREHRGVMMHIERRIDLDEPRDLESWARIGDVLAMTGSAEHLELVIEQVLDGLQGPSLLAAPEHAVAARSLAGSDAYTLVSLASLAPMVRSMIAEKIADADQPPPLDLQAVLTAIGFDDLELVFWGVDLDGRAVTLDIGLTAARETGLLKMIAFGPGKAPRPGIVPASARSMGSTRFDFAAWWQAVEEALNAINPAILAMGGQQLAGVEQKAGVELDLRGDLLDNLAGDFIAFEVPVDDVGGPDASESAETPEPQDQVIALSIRDRSGLERLVNGLKTAMSGGGELFTSREFLGTTVWTFAGPDPSATLPAYAFTDEYLLVSFSNAGHQSLEALLIAASRPGGSAWQRPDVQAALAQLPADAQSVGFQSAESAMRIWTAMLTGFCTAAAGSEDEEGDEEVPCDPANAPDPATLARHLGPIASAWTKQGSSVVLQMIMLPALDSAP